MTRFNPKLGAAALLLLGGGYLVGSLVSHRSARAEPPADLTAAAAETGLDVWKTAALLLDGATLVDVRPAAEQARWRAPAAVAAPGADARAVAALARRKPAAVVLASKDEVAQQLVAAVRRDRKDARVHYLVGGPRAWYLALDLPVPMFAEAVPPRGYDDALARLKAWLAQPDPSRAAPARAALEVLAKASYQPTLLTSGAKPKAKPGGRKKISGGCG